MESAMKTEYRAEHVGSLLRPLDLLEARDANAAGLLPDADLEQLEDSSIKDAVQKQRDIGLDILSDGEMRRGSWLTDMAEAVDGFVRQKVMLDWKGPGGGREASSANAVGAKLHKARKLTGREVPLLRREAPGEFKITLPAPSNFMVSSYKPGVTDAFYPTHSDLLRIWWGLCAMRWSG
jgi:5-methyltetrahydropteroyltriglutamate--homocysteine methyltransferase